MVAIQYIFVLYVADIFDKKLTVFARLLVNKGNRRQSVVKGVARLRTRGMGLEFFFL